MSEPERRQVLWDNTKFMMNGLKSLGFDTGDSKTPVIPVVVGADERAFVMATRLHQEGVFVNAVVSPGHPRRPRPAPHELHGHPHPGPPDPRPRSVRKGRPRVRRHPVAARPGQRALPIVHRPPPRRATPRNREGNGALPRGSPTPSTRGDPHWVAPLLSDRMKVLSDENPLFTHAQMALWVAVRGGSDVGTIAAIVDDHHNACHTDAGPRSLGFFESANEPAVSRLLFSGVRAWAGRLGMKRLVGPMNPSINEECGLLVEGFDRPPVLMMTYNPPYYEGLCEDAGLTRCKDLFAYLVTLDDSRLPRLDRLAAWAVARTAGVTVRPIDRRALARDLAKIQEIYSAAWEDNWGHVPMTAGEVDFMAKRLIRVLDPQDSFALLAETDEEPVAFIVALPDHNEAIGLLRGRLLSPPATPGAALPNRSPATADGTRDRDGHQAWIPKARAGRCALRGMPAGGATPWLRGGQAVMDPRQQCPHAARRGDVRRPPLQDLPAL